MNELEEKLDNMIDAISAFAKAFIRERYLNNVHKENTIKEDNITDDNTQNELISNSEKTNKFRKCKYNLTNGQKKELYKQADQLYKKYKYDNTYSKGRMMADLANLLGYPIMYTAWNRYLNKYELPIHIYKGDQRTNKFKEVACLKSLNIPSGAISVAVGISENSVDDCKDICKLTIDEKKAIFLKYRKYLGNIVRRGNIQLPFNIENLNEEIDTHATDDIIKHTIDDIIKKEASNLTSKNKYISRISLVADLARVLKYPFTFERYSACLDDTIEVEKRRRHRIDKQTLENIECLLYMGIPVHYAIVAVGAFPRCDVSTSDIQKFKHFNAQQLKKAYNCNPEYLDAVAEKFNIDISIVQNNTQDQASSEATPKIYPPEIVGPTDDPASDIPISKHVQYLHYVGGMSIPDIAASLLLAPNKIKDMLSCGGNNKFTTDEVEKLRAKYKFA